MRYSSWQIGMDIQAEGVCAVAIQRHRQGWQLLHLWHLPFSLKILFAAILPQPKGRREAIYGVENHLVVSTIRALQAFIGASGCYCHA